jgi:class 3 adenylate cyclase
VDFVAVLDQVIALLRQRGRLTYGTLKRQFQLDDAALEDLKDELIYGQRVAVDEDDRVLVWAGDTSTAPPAAARAEIPTQTPLAYTPSYLAEKILTSRSALEGERKQVTVLFADLKGSTELIRDLDPEQAQALLDPALRHMMDAVHRYEGTVNQVLGDGIMALFGAPLAHEDHALHACYAALAMQEALRRYAEGVRRAHGLEMQVRVGLNSGEVVVRAIGNDLHMDYSAVGPTTHLAARMEQLATPGSIRLTAGTLRLVEGLVQVNALGPMPVKGLRACLKRSPSGCETPHHQVDHGDPNPRLGRLRQGFEVFTQPPRAIEPAKCAFHDPAPLQDLKTLGAPGAFHNDECPLQHRRDPCDQLAPVPPIGPDQVQARKAGDKCRQHLFGPIAVLDASRMHHHDEEQTQDIDDDVALATAHALAPVIAPDPPFSVVLTV